MECIGLALLLGLAFAVLNAMRPAGGQDIEALVAAVRARSAYPRMELSALPETHPVPPSVEEACKALQAEGFRPAGAYADGVSGRTLHLLVHRDGGTAVVTTTAPKEAPQVDLIATFADGTSYRVSNANSTLGPVARPGHEVLLDRGAAPASLVERWSEALRRRTPERWPADGAPERLTRLHAADQDWRNIQEVTPEVVRQVIAEGGGDPDNAEIYADTLEDLVDDRAYGLIEPILERFRALSGLDAERFEALEERMAVVHARMPVTTALDQVDLFPDEDDALPTGEDVLAIVRAAVERAGNGFTLLGTVDEPVRAEIWLEPEDPPSTA